MIRRISIILLIITALAGPASAGVVVFSLVAYFGNFGDKVNPIKENNLGSGLKSTCTEIPEPIRTYISNAAKQVGMPATFIAATAKKESSFNPKAPSQYAGGVMQLANKEAYDTYDELHTTYKSQYKGATKFTGNRNTDIYLAEYNIYLGAQYTRKLHDQFIDKAKGDKLLELVAAAYNGGPTGLANAGYDYTKMVEETRNYVPKVMEFYRQFEATCKEELINSTADIPTAKALEEYVANNPITACQFTNQTPGVGGSDGCARTARDVLGKAFPGSNTGGDGSWIQTDSRAGGTLSASDLTRAHANIAAGNLPVWHVVGNGSGQHWIVVTGIEGQNVRFYDPETGNIETKLFQEDSKITGSKYFGITSLGGGEGGGANQRGYTFTPSK